MKEKMFAGAFVLLLAITGLAAARSTDAVFIAVTVGFFLLCIAYAEGCGRL